MKIAKGKITTKKSGNGGYKSAWIYIPSKVYKNDLFPFKDNEEIIIEIGDDSLIISRNDDRSKVLREFGEENANLPKVLEIKAEENKNKPFLYYKDQVFSYQEINNASNKIAHGILQIIKENGLIKPKISLLMNNCPEYLFSWFGIVKAAGVFVPLDSAMEEDILEYILNDSDTEILIIDYQYLKNYQKVEENLKKIKRIVVRNAPSEFNFDDEKYIDFQSIETSNGENPKIKIYNDDPVEILYSSGTRGMPKGVLYRSVIIGGVAIGYELIRMGFNEISNLYCPFPLSLGAAHFFAVVPALFYNKSLIITDQFDSKSFWEDIRNYNAECFCYYGGYLTSLLHQKAKIKDRIHQVKFAYGHGTSVDLWEAFEKRFGIPLYECWSHNEGIGITMNKVGSKGGKIGSIGKPLDFLELKIIDLEGNELSPGPNNIGELVFRRKSRVVFEYYKKPEMEDVRIGEYNWVYTGDFGYLDYDGYIYFKGHKTEIVQKSNETIFLRDIERVANSHPSIIETAVIPVYYRKNRDIEFKIFAIKVKNHSLTPEEFSEFLYQNLSYFHVPRFIEFREDLPRSTDTKFLKRHLIEEWENKIPKDATWDIQIRDYLKH
ncbi:MAG: AMP-binding protein [Candidatus Thorarchaeota archaeon]